MHSWKRLVLCLAAFFFLVDSAVAAPPFRFAPPIKYLVGTRPNSVSAADLNGDAKIDLVVTTQNDANVYVLLGRGDGTFDNPIVYTAGTGTLVGSVVGDFNGDGKQDVAVVTQSLGDTTSQALVLLGNGNGTFATTPIPSPANVVARSVKMADVNADGRPDLLIGSFGPACVMLANTDGTFASPTMLPIPGTPTGIYGILSLAAGDLNGDGRVDLAGAATGSSVTAAVVYLQNADGSFQAPVGYLHAHYSNSVTNIFIADISRDGFPDVVETYDTFVDIYTGVGDGTILIPTSTQYAGSTPLSLAFADFNGDGTLDVAAANYNSSTYGTPAGFGVTLRALEQDGTFSTVSGTFDAGDQATAIATADFNGDGQPDVVTANPPTNTIAVLLNGAKTLVTLDLSSNPIMPGQTVTVSSTVTAATGNPPTATGSVVFMDGNAVVGSASLNLSGTATLTLTPSTGYHTLQSLYSGDQNYIGSSSPAVRLSVGYPTTSTLNYTPPNPKQGQAIVFTASASSTYGDVNPGRFQFYEGTKLLGNVTLASGSASLSYSNFGIGSHTVTATYVSTASGTNLLSSSAAVTFTVALNPATTITAAASAARAGSPVTLSANVSAISGNPTGNVTFSDGSTILGTAALSNRSASIVTSALIAGSRTIHFSYEGDGTYDPVSTDLVLQVASADGPAPMAGAFDFLYLNAAYSSSNQALAYDPVLKRIYFVNTNLNRIDVVDAISRTLVGVVSAGRTYGAILDVSADGAFLYSGTSSGLLYKIETQSLQLVGVYRSNGLSFSAMRILSDGTLLVGGSYGHAVRWNYSTGEITDLGVNGNTIITSADHKKALLCSSPSISLYDTATHSITASKTYSGYVYNLSLSASPDFSHFVISSGSYVSVLNGSLLEQYQITTTATRSIVSPDGATFYVMENYTVAAYDVATGTLRSRYPGLWISSSSVYSYNLVTDEGTLIALSGTGLAFFDPSRAPSVPATTNGPSTLFSISPTSGPANASTVVTVQGDSPTYVYFGLGVSQTSIASNGVRVAVAPPSAPGTVNVMELTGGNFPLILPLAFSYGPTISRVEISGGNPDGSAGLRITGYGFGSTPQVQVGGASATNVLVSSSGTYNDLASLQVLTATTPAGTPGGTADIVVTTNTGSTTASKAYHYLKGVHNYAKGGPLTALLYDPARKYVYIANSSKLEIFDIATRTFKTPIYPSSATSNTNLGAMSLNADGSQVVVADLGEMLLHVIDPDTGSSSSISTAVFKDPNWSSIMVVNSIALMSDGRMMITLQQTGCSGCSVPVGIVNLNTRSVTRVSYSSFPSNASPATAVRGGTRVMLGTVGAYDLSSQQLVVTESYYSSNTATDFTEDGRRWISTSNELGNENFSVLQNLSYQGFSNSGSSCRPRFMPGGGLVLRANDNYSPAAPTFDIFDSNTGWLRSRLSLPQAPRTAEYNGVETDETGAVLFIATTNGLTVVELQEVPLSIGSVAPARNTTAGGYEASIAGSGFTAGTTATIAGQSVPVTFVNANKLTFTAPALSNGCYPVVVLNPAGESYSLPCGYDVPAGAGVPVLTSISPSSGTAPVTDVTVIATGTNFTPDSVILFRGVPLITTYKGPTTLQARAVMDGLAGNFSVAVQNPDPDGGTSASLTYSVTNPQASVYGTNPVLFTGSGAQTLTVSGSGFVPNTVVKWDGVERAATFSGSQTLRIEMSAADVATTGTHTLSVWNPPPGGGTSSYGGSMNVKVVDKLPVLSFSSNSTYSLGTVPLGTTSYTGTINVGNNGYATLNITTVSVSGDFQITSTTCNNASIPANYYYGCAINITFTPTEVGNRTGTLTVNDNSAGSPHTVTLTGTGVEKKPIINYQPTIIFPNTALGESSTVYSLSVNNMGYDVLSISSVSLSGSDFQITSNTCAGTTLPTNSYTYCYVNVKFTPTAGGTRTGAITLVDNSAGSPHTVSLTGVGINGVASWSITSIHFDPVLVGSSGASLQVTLTNTGSAALAYGGFHVSGDFAEFDDCPNMLPVGASCTVTILFLPRSLGARNGTAVALSGDQQGIALSGTGADLALTLTRAVRPGRGSVESAPSFQEVQIVSAARTPVSLSCSGAPAGTACVLSSDSVQLDGKAASSVSVQMRSTAAQPPEGIYPVHVTANAGGVVRVIEVPLSLGKQPDRNVASTPFAKTAENVATSPAESQALPRFSVPQPARRPALQVEPKTLEFAGTLEQTLKLSNVSATIVKNLKFDLPDGFAQKNDCADTLAAGTNCTITVTRQSDAQADATVRIESEQGTLQVPLKASRR